VLCKIAIGVAAAALVLLAMAFYIRADIYCSRLNSEGPKIAGAILISGCNH
jgi:hypothetical protein